MIVADTPGRRHGPLPRLIEAWTCFVLLTTESTSTVSPTIVSLSMEMMSWWLGGAWKILLPFIQDLATGRATMDTPGMSIRGAAFFIAWMLMQNG